MNALWRQIVSEAGRQPVYGTPSSSSSPATLDSCSRSSAKASTRLKTISGGWRADLGDQRIDVVVNAEQPHLVAETAQRLDDVALALPVVEREHLAVVVLGRRIGKVEDEEELQRARFMVLA